MVKVRKAEQALTCNSNVVTLDLIPRRCRILFLREWLDDNSILPRISGVVLDDSSATCCPSAAWHHSRGRFHCFCYYTCIPRSEHAEFRRPTHTLYTEMEALHIGDCASVKVYEFCARVLHVPNLSMQNIHMTTRSLGMTVSIPKFMIA